MIRIKTYAIGAGSLSNSPTKVDIGFSKLAILNSSELIEMQIFDKGGRQRLDATDITAGLQFGPFPLSCDYFLVATKSGNAGTVCVAFADADEEFNVGVAANAIGQALQVVNLNDPLYASMLGQSFTSVVALAGGGAAKYSCASIYHNTAGTVLLVKRFTGFTASADIVVAVVDSTALAAATTPNIVAKNRYLANASIATVKSDNTITSIAGTTPKQVSQAIGISTNGQFQFDWTDDPIVLGPNAAGLNFLSLYQNTANIALSGFFEWDEIPTSEV
jgi:hypothetical protein